MTPASRRRPQNVGNPRGNDERHVVPKAVRPAKRESVERRGQLVDALSAVRESLGREREGSVMHRRIRRYPDFDRDQVIRLAHQAGRWSTETQRRSRASWITVRRSAASAVRSAASKSLSLSTRTPRAPQALAMAAKSTGPSSVPTPSPDPRPSCHIRIVPWSDELDEAVRLAHNEAFADHWGSEPRTAQEWTQGRSMFAPTRIAVRPGA